MIGRDCRWGGDFEHSSGKTLRLTNTCLFDNFFQILYSFYSMNMHQMRKLFETEDAFKKDLRNSTASFSDQETHIVMLYDNTQNFQNKELPKNQRI